MRYSLRLIDKDWNIIRDVLKRAGHDDVLGRMNSAPYCTFCRLHPDNERERAINSFCHEVGALVETKLSGKV